MSYKLLHSPLKSTGGVSPTSIKDSWSSLPFNHHEAEFLRSWVIYDLELDAPRYLNRDVVLGMGVVLLVSAGFWTGVAFAIAQAWK